MDERFWSKVNKTDTCWLWTAATSHNGYGVFGVRLGGFFKATRVHRIVYEIFYGQIPEGMCICHKCDIRNCVNPGHLFLGTVKDNNQDTKNKGRMVHLRGVEHPRATISQQTVIDMRQDHANGLTINELSAKYNCAVPNVNRIIKRLTWKHI